MTVGAGRRVGLAVSALVVPVAALSLAASVVIATGAARGTRLAAYAVTAACTAAAGGVVAAFAGRFLGLPRAPLAVARALAQAARRPRELAAGALVGLAVLATATTAAGLVERAFGADEGVLEKLRVAVVEADAAGLALAVVGLVLLPAVCEELLFRGVVYGALEIALGGAAAVVGSAALFGAYHLDPRQGLVAFVSGLVLGEIRRLRGGVGLGVVAHALNNAAALALSRTGSRGDELAGPLALAAAAGVAALAVFGARRRARALAARDAREAASSAVDQGVSPESWTSSP